jgi:hypothetical protein
MPKRKRYVETLTELAHEIGVSPKTISTWKRDHGSSVPHELPDGRIDVVAWQEWRREVAKNSMGDGSLKDEKLKREIRLLDLEIEERIGNLKPMSEWVAEVREIAAITKASMQHFVAWVSAEIRTPEAYNKAEELAERLCSQLAQKVEDAGGNNT